MGSHLHPVQPGPSSPCPVVCHGPCDEVYDGQHGVEAHEQPGAVHQLAAQVATQGVQQGPAGRGRGWGWGWGFRGPGRWGLV